LTRPVGSNIVKALPRKGAMSRVVAFWFPERQGVRSRLTGEDRFKRELWRATVRLALAGFSETEELVFFEV
jgi:hypothetical protein